jgi:thymidylate synthase (FAD)
MMTVDLVDCMGSDLSVVNAARVSMDKHHTEFDPVADTRLIQYLAREGHWTPFAHTALSFRISAPLFVARQLAKHVVGLCWNEMSRRYIESAPCFYAPDEWRGRAIDVKQGSGGAIENQWLANEVYHEAMRVMDDAYLQLLDIGVAPEQARMILPQSMLTTWIWTGSLYAFARVCRLRLDHHAQMETQQVAQEIAVHCERIFPVSWPSLMGELKA